MKTTHVYMGVNMDKNAEEFHSHMKEVLLFKCHNIR